MYLAGHGDEVAVENLAFFQSAGAIFPLQKRLKFIHHREKNVNTVKKIRAEVSEFPKAERILDRSLMQLGEIVSLLHQLSLAQLGASLVIPRGVTPPELEPRIVVAKGKNRADNLLQITTTLCHRRLRWIFCPVFPLLLQYDVRCYLSLIEMSGHFPPSAPPWKSVS